MKNINASIVTIGDELLIGQVIDTNSAWMAQQLNAIGITVIRRIAVGDNGDDIIRILDDESKWAEVILMTGGLGPTSDDKTKKVLLQYFGGRLVVNEDALANVKYLVEKVFKRPVTDINLEQAQVPDVCEVIQNKRGTAPGMIFYKNNIIYVSMPGVPYEMKGIMEDAVIPMLKQKFILPIIVHRTLLTAGIGESALAEKIKDFEDDLPKDIRVAYLPTYGMVRLRLSTSGFDKKITEEKINQEFEKLKNFTKEYLVTDEDEPLQAAVGKILTAKNKTVSTAESCTGGYIAHLITTVPGSSKYFEGSIVSYSNEVKKQRLGVHENTLNTYGAVSEETVIEMLNGLLHQMNTDYGIAVSGIMGPDGGAPDKPVGTAWMAAGDKKNYRTQKINLRFNRERNIEVTAMMALNFLRKFIVGG